MKRKIMALLLIFSMMCNMLLPGGTLMVASANEIELICEQAEHSHGEDCYTYGEEIICGLEEFAGHTHGVDCYDAKTELTCGLEETAGHAHDDGCYAWSQEMICGSTEEGHEHDDSCYEDVQGELTCTEEETEGHQHGEDCYTITETLICGETEVNGHKHDDTCLYDKQISCTVEESEGHTHSNACRAATLVCDIAEHTHSAECYKQSDASEPVIPEAPAEPADGKGTPDGEFITLDFLPAGLIAESESMTDTTAIITANPVTLYKSLDNGAEGIEVTVESGTVIDLITKYTFATDTGSLIFYRYDYYGTNEALNDAALSEHSGYVFVYSGDISIQGTDNTGNSGSIDTPAETEKTDVVTGVVVSAELPEDVTLTVTQKTLEESGLDTTAYPVSGASLFYDVTLYQNSAEYQPENGITVTFPEAAITGSGLGVGDSYNVYHIHDGIVDMTGPFTYDGGDISAEFENLSVVGIAETSTAIDLVDQHGEGTVAYLDEEIALTINSDSVTLYDGYESNVYTVEVTGASGIEVEAYAKVTFADGFVLYQYAYYGDDSDFTTVANTYQFIAVTDTVESGGQEIPGIGAGEFVDDEFGVSLAGNLPTGGKVEVTPGAPVPDYLIENSQMQTVGTMALDITPYDADGNEWQPGDKPVTVSIADVYDPENSDAVVYVYHILDYAGAIVDSDGNIKDGVLLSYDEEMIETYNDEAALAKTALGLDEPVVAYEVFSTHNGLVTLNDDGSISFDMDSFSKVTVLTGTMGYYLVIFPGSSGTITVPTTDNITVTNRTGGINATTSSSWKESTVTVTADESLAEGVYTLSLDWGNNTADVSVIVTNSDDVSPLYLYGLIPGANSSDTSNGAADKIWFSLGIGAIVGAGKPDNSQTITYGEASEKYTLLLPSYYPDLSMGGDSYSYSSSPTNDQYKYMIDWWRLVEAAAGANVGNNNYIQEVNSNIKTWHLDAILRFNETSYFSVYFKVLGLSADNTWDIYDVVPSGYDSWYTQRVKNGTNESSLRVPGKDNNDLPVKEGYTFSGWHKDEACTQKAMFESTVTQNTTYYGKFVRNTIDLTITKTGVNETLDPNQSFIFTVTGSDGFTMDVVINGNGSVTIKDLPADQTYTVTENTDWSCRYTPVDDGNQKQNSQTVNLSAGANGTVTFNNMRDEDKWLSGDCYCKNWWDSTNVLVTKRKVSN